MWCMRCVWCRWAQQRHGDASYFEDRPDLELQQIAAYGMRKAAIDVEEAFALQAIDGGWLW